MENITNTPFILLSGLSLYPFILLSFYPFIPLSFYPFIPLSDLSKEQIEQLQKNK